MLALQIAIPILFFLLGLILGKLWNRKPHCAGKLIIDEKGETERWSFMLDDDVDNVKEQKVIFLEIDRRA